MKDWYSRTGAQAPTQSVNTSMAKLLEGFGSTLNLGGVDRDSLTTKCAYIGPQADVQKLSSDFDIAIRSVRRSC